jgi:thiol-disulfide isomerase/thioredoxin
MKIWMIILIVFGLFVGLYAVQQVLTRVKYNYQKETFNETKLRVLLIYAEWCGHCRSYRNANTFMKTYDEHIKPQSKYDGVVFEEIDSDKNKDKLDKYNIRGFPTIIAVKADGTFIDEFGKNRDDPEDLKTFVSACLTKI